MCGRFTLQVDAELLAEIFGLSEIPAFPLEARYNIAPTQLVPVVRRFPDLGDRLDLLRWGLIPSWTKQAPSGPPLINARSETAAEKPAFRHAVKRRRCLIPASGFYEWRREGEAKVPLYIRLKDGSPMAFAGIWEAWTPPEGPAVESFSILTTAANDLLAAIHDRMPVLIDPADRPAWLNAEVVDPDWLKQLFRPFPAGLMEMFAVSSLVNSSRNNSPELIVPLSA